MRERAQANTLEAFTAALLLVAGVTFALQATAVTPLSASTSNQHIQNQQRLVANDLLASAHENGTLAESLLFWNDTEEAFQGTTNRTYFTDGGPPTTFGESLNATFRDDRIAFNVYIEFRDGAGFSTQRLVFMGTPSDNAVAVSRSVAVYNDTVLTADNPITLAEAFEADSFYAPDTAIGGELYNVLEVRIVVWRM